MIIIMYVRFYVHIQQTRRGKKRSEFQQINMIPYSATSLK